MSAELIKLKALKNNVFSLLKGTTAREQLRPTAFYDPLDVENLFTRFNTIRDTLIQTHPHYFNDFPIRDVKPTKGRDFGGRGSYERKQFDILLNDINASIDLLEGISSFEMPSMSISREGIFFAGQAYNAITYFRDILLQCQKEFVLIDGYVSNKVLDMLSAKKPGVSIKILSGDVKQSFVTYSQVFNQDYGGLQVRSSRDFHDRFVIVDDSDFYHFGHSIKDLGTRGFMFSRIEEPSVIDTLRNQLSKSWNNALKII